MTHEAFHEAHVYSTFSPLAAASAWTFLLFSFFFFLFFKLLNS